MRDISSNVFSQVLLLVACSRLASASLILDESLPPDVIGHAKPGVILSLHGPNAGTVSGCVAWDGFTDIIGPDACAGTGSTGGGEMNGASQTLTLTIGEAGITSADSFAVFFQPSEAHNSTLALDNLVLQVFSANGTVLFTSGPFLNAIVVTESLPGQPLGFVFRVPVEELGSVPEEIFTNPTNRIGLSATVSGASGGPERFGIIAWDTPPEPVPEPASVFLLPAALAAICLRRHARSTRAQPPNRTTAITELCTSSTGNL